MDSVAGELIARIAQERRGTALVNHVDLTCDSAKVSRIQFALKSTISGNSRAESKIRHKRMS
jgi:hypothetical protein